MSSTDPGGARDPRLESAHADHPGFVGVVRGHLGLDVPEGGLLRCEGQARAWADGAWLFFRTEREHEAVNLSARPRTVLLLDVEEAAHPERHAAR